MPSAKKRSYNARPVSREAYDRHNQHKHETYWDVKRQKDREERTRPKHVPSILMSCVFYEGEG